MNANNVLPGNFTEVIMNANKEFPQIWLPSVNFEKFIFINLLSDQSQSFKNSTVIGC